MTIPTACVIGWPVAHSRSPLIHGYWLRQLRHRRRLRHACRSRRTDRRRSSRGFARQRLRRRQRHRAAQGSGLRRRRRGRARRAARSAPSTRIWVEDGRLVGDNTDARRLPRQSRRERAWLGRDAGPGRGARRRRRGARGRLRAGRARLRADPSSSTARRARAEALADALRRRRPAGGAGTTLPAALGRRGVLVNTTSLGMKGQPPLDIDLGRLAADALVTDIVYVPLETALLAAARRARPRAPSTGSACCSTRRCPASSAGSACARGDAGAARRGRSPTSGRRR